MLSVIFNPVSLVLAYSFGLAVGTLYGIWKPCPGLSIRRGIKSNRFPIARRWLAFMKIRSVERHYKVQKLMDARWLKNVQHILTSMSFREED
jgi:hypothetical protein